MAELRHELSWSASRSRSFGECRRAYFYLYYGSWRGWERDAPGPVRRAYLLKRRAATQRREASAQAGAELAEEIHAALAGATVLSRRLAPQDRRLTGHTGEMVLNGTYLVDASGVAAFKDLVARLASEHPLVRLEVGGPWPPYTFASLDPQ